MCESQVGQSATCAQQAPLAVFLHGCQFVDRYQTPGGTCIVLEACMVKVISSSICGGKMGLQAI